MTNTLILKKAAVKSAAFLLLSSLSVTLPFVFHLAGWNTLTLLPIFTAVLIAAVYLDPVTALLVAVAAPLLNHLITGMPAVAPVPVMQMLLLELIVLSLSASYLKWKKVPVIILLAVSMILARVVSMIFIPFSSSLSLTGWFQTRITGLPGTILNPLVVSLIYLISSRWKK
jgi:hypothetical protein